MNNLGVVSSDQGKYKEAEEIYRRVLAVRGKILGKEHPDTLLSVYCLAHSLHQQKQYKEAEVLYQRAYAGMKKVFGEKHPTTEICLQNYSSMLREVKGG